MKKTILKSSSSLLLFFCTQSLLAADVPPCKPDKITDGMTIISFAPLFLYVVLLIVIFWKLQLEKYKIGDSLRENQTIDVSIDNPAYTPPPANPVPPVQNGGAPIPPAVPPLPPANPATPFVGKTIQPQSMSRLLAFISGIMTLGLASSFSSFWLYRYFECGIGTDLSQITNVLLALGLGLLPYAVNKISTAASK
ncbi:hypothetical protein [Flavobacterium sp.]|uniref:hypothetical protein n=1 Tax=Flavobacterium sp. TaxID=239 RepID=UPI002FDA5364